MQAEPEQPPQAEPHRGPNLHDATMLLQEFLQLSDRFTRMLGSELQVNATDFRAMEHLLRDGSLTPGDLARRLGISGAAMTTSVDRLVARGHVSRQPDPADRRSVRVIPAQASTERAGSILTPMIRAVDEDLGGYSAGEQRVITEYLRKVVETMRVHASGPSAQDELPAAPSTPGPV